MDLGPTGNDNPMPGNEKQQKQQQTVLNIISNRLFMQFLYTLINVRKGLDSCQLYQTILLQAAWSIGFN